jgi:hypothetical protein
MGTQILYSKTSFLATMKKNITQQRWANWRKELVFTGRTGYRDNCYRLDARNILTLTLPTKVLSTYCTIYFSEGIWWIRKISGKVRWRVNEWVSECMGWWMDGWMDVSQNSPQLVRPPVNFDTKLSQPWACHNKRSGA